MKAYQMKELSSELEKLKALNKQEQNMLNGYKEQQESYFLSMAQVIDKRKKTINKKIKELQASLTV